MSLDSPDDPSADRRGYPPRARLGEGRTSVGTRVELEHRAAGPVGTRVTAVAELVEADGRRLVFEAGATDGRGTEVARARIERAVVDRERFMARSRG